MPARNYKAQFGLAIKIYFVILNNIDIWLVNTKPQKSKCICQISPRRTCNQCGYTTKMNSRYHRLLIHDVKRTTKIDGMGPFNIIMSQTDGGITFFISLPETNV